MKLSNHNQTSHPAAPPMAKQRARVIDSNKQAEPKTNNNNKQNTYSHVCNARQTVIRFVPKG
eukprot:909730-Amphidinium_carterae.1